VADGLSNAAIAEWLFLGEATVKTHVLRILTKTGSENRVQIALLVYESRSSWSDDLSTGCGRPCPRTTSRR
jgi:DNA-binding NarL/FixJ family response regulator